MPLHPQTAAFLKLIDTGAAPAEPDIDAMRAATRANPYRGAGPEVAEVEDGVVGDVPIRTYRPRRGTLPALVYFHGGGWSIGDLDTADPMCRRLAAEAGCVVVSAGFRLAPRHPFPAALGDSYTGTAHGVPPAGRYGGRPDAGARGGGRPGGHPPTG